MRSLLSILLVLMCTAALAEEPETPGVFHNRNPRVATPLWIAAEEALDSDGRIRLDTVAAYDADQLHRIIDALPADSELHTHPAVSARCEHTFSGAFTHELGMSSPPDDWEGLADRAAAGKVFFGHVTGTRVGLYHGMPFTVLTIRARQAMSEAESATVHLLYPKGSMLIERRRICTDDRRYPPPPKVGEEIVFVAKSSISKDGSLYRVPLEQVFFTRAGCLIVPRRLRCDPHVQTFGSLRAVRDALLSRRAASP